MAHSTLRNFLALAALTVSFAALPAQSQTTPPAASSTPAQAAPAATPTPAQPAADAPPQKGMVWVNTASGVYHAEGTKYYGKTKHGKYMTEADAQKAGYHAAKQKAKP